MVFNSIIITPLWKSVAKGGFNKIKSPLTPLFQRGEITLIMDSVRTTLCGCVIPEKSGIQFVFLMEQNSCLL